MTPETFSKKATAAIRIPAHVKVSRYTTKGVVDFVAAQLYVATPVTWSTGVRLEGCAVVRGADATPAKAIDALWAKVESGDWMEMSPAERAEKLNAARARHSTSGGRWRGVYEVVSNPTPDPMGYEAVRASNPEIFATPDHERVAFTQNGRHVQWSEVTTEDLRATLSRYPSTEHGKLAAVEWQRRFGVSANSSANDRQREDGIRVGS